MIWRAIPDWPDYEVSERGDIRRSRPASNGFVGLRKPYNTKTGVPYLYIVLRKAGKKRAFAVHRLVALAFIGPSPFEGAQVRHDDGNSLNNHWRNLAWSTRSENEQQKVEHGTSNRGERARMAALTRAQVIEIRDAIARGEMQKDIAKRYGVHPATISSINVRQSWAWL